MTAVLGFAAAVDPLAETRVELVREIHDVLARYELHRCEEDRGRLLALLECLALLVRAG